MTANFFLQTLLVYPAKPHHIQTRTTEQVEAQVEAQVTAQVETECNELIAILTTIIKKVRARQS